MRTPPSVVVVRIIAVLGIVFWLTMMVRAVVGMSEQPVWLVLILGLVLGGAHVLIGRWTPSRSLFALRLTWFVLVADVLLGFLVDPRAFVLAAASVALLAAGLRARRVVR